MNISRLVLPAPAKLNLMLRITGRRTDGYHELQSVFQFIDLCDTITLEITADGTIERSRGNDAVPSEQDLLLRAAALLRQHTGCQPGARIAIEKHIPMGAGLGGGSSDAATVLLGLNRLWGCDLSTESLATLGLGLGADVPVFVHGFAAFAEGVGERLAAIELAMPWYLVITPQVHVSTAEIFNASELTRDCPAIKISHLFQGGSPDLWQNVCTPVAVARYPEIGQALALLGEHAESRMSGTGASVFAAFESEQEASVVAAQMREHPESDGWNIVIAQGLNRSPLMAALDR